MSTAVAVNSWLSPMFNSTVSGFSRTSINTPGSIVTLAVAVFVAGP